MFTVKIEVASPKRSTCIKDTQKRKYNNESEDDCDEEEVDYNKQKLSNEESDMGNL